MHLKVYVYIFVYQKQKEQIQRKIMNFLGKHIYNNNNNNNAIFLGKELKHTALFIEDWIQKPIILLNDSELP